MCLEGQNLRRLNIIFGTIVIYCNLNVLLLLLLLL